MGARKFVFAFYVFFCCLSVEEPSAQPFIFKSRQFVTPGFHPVVPGSLYDRLLWPRPMPTAARPERSPKAVRVFPPVKTPRPVPATKTKLGTALAPVPPRTVPVLAKATRAPDRPANPWSSLGLRGIFTAAIVVLAGLAWRLLRSRLTARRIETRTPFPPAQREEKAQRSRAPSPIPELSGEAEGAPQSFAGPEESRAASPGRHESGVSPLAGGNQRRDAHDTTTPRNAIDDDTPRAAPNESQSSQRPIEVLDDAQSQDPLAGWAPGKTKGKPDRNIAAAEEVFCLVPVTEGNLRNNHLYLPLDFFPEDAIGGANFSMVAPKTVSVTFDPGETIKTDIDGTKRILRDRSAIRRFFARGDFEEGDVVRISRVGPYAFVFRKEPTPKHRASHPTAPALETAPLGDAITDAQPSPASKTRGESEADAPVVETTAEALPVPGTQDVPVEGRDVDPRAAMEHGRDSTEEVDQAPSDRDGLGDVILAPEPAEALPAPSREIAPQLDFPAMAEDAAPSQQAVSVIDHLQTRDQSPEPTKRAAGEAQLEAPAIAPTPETAAPPCAPGVDTRDDAEVPAPPRSERPQALAQVAPPAPPAKVAQASGTELEAVHPIVAPKPSEVLDQSAYGLFRPILARAGDDAPDARPLYTYAYSQDEFAAIETFLERSLRKADPTIATGAAFVFWAAEHIRAHFPAGEARHLSWSFVFDHFGLPEDGNQGRRLTRLGMAFWRRPIREAIDGSQLYLYSLMAEGGLPEALLREEGLYQRVVLKLLEDIEARGGPGCGAEAAKAIATRAVGTLPPIFHDDNLIALLGAFGVALAQLRSRLPPGLPPEDIRRWLDENTPGWARTLPLRASAETLNGLIVPALQIEPVGDVARGPDVALAARELRRDLDGGFRGFVRFADEAWLPGALLPAGAEGLRLRLLPGGALAASGAALFFFADPDGSGWRARRAGRSPFAAVPLALSQSVTFTALTDGRPVGEIAVDPGVPDPKDAVTLWRPSGDRASEDVLAPSPSGRVRASCLYALVPADVRPEASAGLSLSQEPWPAEGGALWRVSGKGALVFDDTRLKIDTGADTDAPAARLTAFGETIADWKTRGGSLVFVGRVDVCGQRGDGALEPLAPPRLLTRPTRGRVLGEYVAEWVEEENTLARLRYVYLPVRSLTVRETGDGEARLRIEGLAISGLLVTARAGEAATETTLVGGAGELTLKTKTAPPGQIELTLSEPAAGKTLTLVTAWPAQRGMILDLDGRRLSQDTAIAAEELYQWRAVAPGTRCDLVVRVQKREIVLPIAGETPLGIFTPLIRALLVLGTRDVQADICVRSGGEDGFQLRTRLYADSSRIRNGVLYTGLSRDAPPPPKTALADALAPRRIAKFHAVDLRAGAALRLEAETPCDLYATLGEAGGPWLIAPRLDGRPQRPVVFNPLYAAQQRTTDEHLALASEVPAQAGGAEADLASAPTPAKKVNVGPPTAKWIGKWQKLVQSPDDPEWTRLTGLVEALAACDGAGLASEVQALAEVPQAAILLAVRVRVESLEKTLDLDKAAPIFWPALRVVDFTAAVAKAAEIDDAGDGLFTRIRQILILRPELSAHFGRALTDAGLVMRVFQDERQTALRALLTSGDSLEALAQLVAKRAHIVPDAFDRLTPLHVGLSHALNSNHYASFNAHTRKLVDAPIVVAEMAAGLRPQPTRAEMMSLIGLRFVDSLYFDAAVPAALKLALEIKQ